MRWRRPKSVRVKNATSNFPDKSESAVLYSISLTQRSIESRQVPRIAHRRQKCCEEHMFGHMTRSCNVLDSHGVPKGYDEVINRYIGGVNIHDILIMCMITVIGTKEDLVFFCRSTRVELSILHPHQPKLVERFPNS